jgi:hypothetical protein
MSRGEGGGEGGGGGKGGGESQLSLTVTLHNTWSYFHFTYELNEYSASKLSNQNLTSNLFDSKTLPHTKC